MKDFGATITILALIVGGLFLGGMYHFNENTQTCTVSGKESVVKDGDHEYRVYTEECGTLVVKDTLIRGRFNSSDTYGKLKENESYELTTNGWRVPVFSMFPNILKVL